MKAIIVSAPSGAGKTSLVNELMKEVKSLTFSISTTSRKPRKYEKDKKNYYFVSIKEFKNMLDNKKFIEHEEVYKNQFYGTSISEIERAKKNKKNLVFDVDVLGGINLKKYFKEKALSVFIYVKDIKELEKRLKSRNTENKESIQKRIKRASFEIEKKKEFDIIIENIDFEKAKNKLIKNVIKFINEK